jgi:kynurenine formamidase
MSRALRLVDVSVPLQPGLATCPGNPEFELQPVKRVAAGGSSIEPFKTAGAPAYRALLGDNVVIIEGLDRSDAEPGQYEMYCLRLRVSGADGAPARVVLKR